MTSDDRLIHLVFTAQHRLRTHLKNALDKAGVRITPAQAGILFLLKQHDGQSMSQLSQVLSLDNSTITGLIHRLEKSDFVKRIPSSEDRRISRIHITPQGMEEIGGAEIVVQRVNETIRSGFSPEEINVFKSVLNSFFGKFNKGK